MRGSDFIFDCIKLLYFKCNKINVNCGGSQIDFPNRIKTKKTKLKPDDDDDDDDDDDKCFQHAEPAASNHEEIGPNSQRILKIKTFVNKCNWKGINYSSAKNVWKKFEKNIRKLRLMCYMLKNQYVFCRHFKTQFKSRIKLF